MAGENTPMTPLKSGPGHDDSGIAFSPGQTPPGQTPSSPEQVQRHRIGVSTARKRLETKDALENNGVRTEEGERSSEETDQLQAGPSRDKSVWTKDRLKLALITISALLVISFAINVWLAVSCHNKCKDNDMKHQVTQENQKLELCASLLPCPTYWIWTIGKCYFFSKEKKTWDESQKFCASYNGTLAIILDQYTLDTIRHYQTIDDPWIGLRKINTVWQWLSSNPFLNLSLPLAQDGPGLHCAYLNEYKYGVLDCTSKRNFICTSNSSFSMAEIPALG